MEYIYGAIIMLPGAYLFWYLIYHRWVKMNHLDNGVPHRDYEGEMK